MLQPQSPFWLNNMISLNKILHDGPKMPQWAFLTLIYITVAIRAVSQSVFIIIITTVPFFVNIITSISLVLSAIGIGLFICELFQAHTRRLIKWQGVLWLLLLFAGSSSILYMFIRFYLEKIEKGGSP